MQTFKHDNLQRELLHKFVDIERGVCGVKESEWSKDKDEGSGFLFLSSRVKSPGLSLRLFMMSLLLRLQEFPLCSSCLTSFSS